MGLEQGLTAEEAEQLARQGKANVVPSKSNSSVASIVAHNVFTYFNGIFALLAALVIIAGAYKSLTFLPVIIANTIIGIVQQLRAKKVLDKLALLSHGNKAVTDGGSFGRMSCMVRITSIIVVNERSWHGCI